MASPYDITFLRLLMDRQLAQKPQAMQCIQEIDSQAQRGRKVSAAQLVVQLGLVDVNQAREFDALARRELEQANGGGLPPAPAALPGLPPTPAALPPTPGALPPPPALPQTPGALPPTPGPLPPTPGALPPTPGALPQLAPLPPPPSFEPAPPPPPQPGLAPGSPPSSPPPPAPAPAPPPPAPGPGPAPSPPAGGDEGEEYYALEGALAGYQTGPKVGRGPVGTTYRGRRSNGDPVVIKALSKRFSKHPEVVRQVEDDIARWKGFAHPAVVSVLDVGQSNGRTVIVNAQARGENLAQLLEASGPMAPVMAMRVIYDVAIGLASAREKVNLACGDVRADKIYFDGKHAQLADVGQWRASCLGNGFGKHGLTFGHPAYLAPEVIQESQPSPTPAADVYALGILFYELLCGQQPFRGEVVDVLSQHLEAPLPPPPEKVRFSSKLAALILRMTAKSPSQRLPDAAAVVDSITALLAGKGLPPAPKQSNPVTGDEWERTQAQNRATGRWSRSRIDAAPAIGPSEFGKAMELGAASSVSGSLGGAIRPKEAGVEIKLGKKLGRGVAGTTYEGTHTKFPGKLAIKVISKRFAQHKELRNEIKGGLRRLVGADIPGVVPVLSLEESGGRDLLVSPLIPHADTLRKRMEDSGPFMPSVATGFIKSVVAALAAADRAGLHHGDLRPGKILLDGEGQALLIDFGFARASCLAAGYGKIGQPFGHPGYLAPEVVQESKKQPTRQADMYALGITYYELICGKAPYSGEPKELLRQHLEAPLPRPPDDVSLPGAVANLITGLTSKNPDSRPATWEDVLEELNECLGLDGSAFDRPSAQIEEFDPLTDDGEEPMVEVWEMTSEILAKPSGNWDKSKITQAKPVGPDDIAAGTVDLTASEGENLVAAIKAAEASERPAATTTRTKRGGKRSAGGSASSSSSSSAGGSGKQLVLALGALLLVIGGIAALALNAGDGEQTASTNPTHDPPPHHGNGNGNGNGNGGTGVDDPPPDVKKWDDLASDLEREVTSELRSNDFKDAIRVLDGVDAAALEQGVVADAVARLRTNVQTKYREELVKAESDLLEHVRSGRVRDAHRLASRVKGWALEVADGQALADRIDVELRTLHGAVAELKLSDAPPVETLQEQLAKVLGGWATYEASCLVFEGGGIVLRYPDGGAQSPEDWELLSKHPEEERAKLTPATDSLPNGGRALRLVGGETPTVLRFKLPLRQLVDARLRIVIGREAKASSRFTILPLVGNPTGDKADGLDWGIYPLPFHCRRGSYVRDSNSGRDLKLLTPLEPLELLVAVRGAKGTGVLKTGAEKPTRGKAQISVDEQGGYLMLVLRDTEVWLTDLEVRGLFDPERVAK